MSKCVYSETPTKNVAKKITEISVVIILFSEILYIWYQHFYVTNKTILEFATFFWPQISMIRRDEFRCIVYRGLTVIILLD